MNNVITNECRDCKSNKTILNYAEGKWNVVCRDCLHAGPLFDTKDGAIGLWNDEKKEKC